MKIDLTPEQYRELIHIVATGTTVRASVLSVDEDVEEEELLEAEALQNYLLSYAKAFDAADLVREGEAGTLVMSEDLIDATADMLLEHIEISFWPMFARKMAMRDFEKTATSAEMKQFEESETPPKRLSDLYQRYANELQEYELDRFQVKW